jgi:hypothetical protein
MFRLGLECNHITLNVTYLLEYYVEKAFKHTGWLITVSEALMDLYEYKLGSYLLFFFR